jgi:hypothetical protein
MEPFFLNQNRPHFRVAELLLGKSGRPAATWHRSSPAPRALMAE